MITLRFKKRKTADEQDAVAIDTEDGSWCTRAWNQRIIPHEMVHYAVEAIYPLRGFVRLTADGRSPIEIVRQRDPEAIFAENLTGTYQYELWGMAEPTNERFLANLGALLDMQDVPEVEPAQIERGRALIERLTCAWEATPPGETLVLELPRRVPGEQSFAERN